MNIQTSQQQDMFNQSVSLNKTSGDLLNKMTQLAKEAQGTTDAQKLQQIQIQLADLQRSLDTMKQLEEKMAKAMETINKFVQPQ